MAGIPSTSGVGYRKKLLKAWATPSEVAATPDTSEAGFEYGAGMSRAGVHNKYLSNAEKDLALSTEKLRLTREKNDMDVALTMRYLDELRSQNNIASWLGLAGTAVSGMAAYSEEQKQNARDALTRQQIAEMQGVAGSMSTMYDDLLSGVAEYRRKAGLTGISRVAGGY
jgi:hypothetical protein